MTGRRELLSKYSKLGLGTGTGFKNTNNASIKDFHNIFKTAKDTGINWLDTAEAYSDGYAETIIGDYLRANPHSFFVASKFSPINATHAALKLSCERSLKRLNKDCIDLYQIHWMNYSVPLEETVGALIELKKEGKVNAIGVCNFSSLEVKTLENLGLEISSNQVEFNLFNRAVGDSFLKEMEKKCIGVIGYSPFDGITTLDVGSEKHKVLDNISKKYSSSMHKIALAYLTSFSNMFISYSSTNAHHIKQNNNSIHLSAEDIEAIDSIFDSSVQLVDTSLIKVNTNKAKKSYVSLDEALENKYGYFPGVMELADEFNLCDYFKPIKIRELEGDSHYKYELIGGMMRYWGWISAKGSSSPIPSIHVGS